MYRANFALSDYIFSYLLYDEQGLRLVAYFEGRNCNANCDKKTSKLQIKLQIIANDCDSIAYDCDSIAYDCDSIANDCESLAKGCDSISHFGYRIVYIYFLKAFLQINEWIYQI